MSKNKRIGNSKSYKASHNSSKGIIYELDFVGPIKPTKDIHGKISFLLPQIMLLSGWKQEH
jgi:hypothetical protein